MEESLSPSLCVTRARHFATVCLCFLTGLTLSSSSGTDPLSCLPHCALPWHLPSLPGGSEEACLLRTLGAAARSHGQPWCKWSSSCWVPSGHSTHRRKAREMAKAPPLEGAPSLHPHSGSPPALSLLVTQMGQGRLFEQGLLKSWRKRKGNRTREIKNLIITNTTFSVNAFCPRKGQCVIEQNCCLAISHAQARCV